MVAAGADLQSGAQLLQFLNDCWLFANSLATAAKVFPALIRCTASSLKSAVYDGFGSFCTLSSLSMFSGRYTPSTGNRNFGGSSLVKSLVGPTQGRIMDLTQYVLECMPQSLPATLNGRRPDEKVGAGRTGLSHYLHGRSSMTASSGRLGSQFGNGRQS